MIAKTPDRELDKSSDAVENESAVSDRIDAALGVTPKEPTFGAYGGMGYEPLNLSPDQWKKEADDNAGKPWTSSLEGRLAIRAFSRGVMGAAFFAVGNRYCRYAMNSFDPAKGLKPYHPEQALSEVHWTQAPMHFMAKTFDTVAGKPIKMVVNALGGDGERATTFRHSHTFASGMVVNNKPRGRSLGHEVMSVTFDFAAMSVGDGIGHDIAGLFDPNVKKSWIKDGKIDYPQAVKQLASNTFRYLSYNAGEDWAVALPYVYYIRAQRNLINKFSPGFLYDSDRGLNGGSLKVDDHGKVIGNYNIEGALDLQGRFTAYNAGTLMYREAYLGMLDKYQRWKDDGTPMFQMDEKKSLLESAWDGIKSLTRWVARDSIKATIYMTPSMPFFWMTRAPQTKYKGLFIHPEKGVVTYWNKDFRNPITGMMGRNDAVHANEMRHRHGGDFGPETPLYFRNYDDRTMRWDGGFDQPAANMFTDKGFNPYNETFGPVDKVLNTFGSISNNARREQHRWVRNLGKKYGYDWNAPIGSSLERVNPRFERTINTVKDLQNAYTLAAISYTPYFMAKTDTFSHMWDNGRMDNAVERTLDGIGSLNPSEFGAGVAEIWQTIKGGPLRDPEREADAKRAMEQDLSPPDLFKPKLLDPDHTREVKFSEMVRDMQQKKPEDFRTSVNAAKPPREQAKPVRQREEGESHVGVLEKQAAERDAVTPPGVTIH